MTVTLAAGSNRRNVTVPQHRDVRVGTLDGIIADFLGLPKHEVRDTLVG